MAETVATRVNGTGILLPINDIAAYARLSPADVEAFGLELDTIRTDVEESLGTKDATYIRRTIAFQLMGRAGLLPNRLTNSWVPFLVAAMLLLKPHGRLAMVIPAELLQFDPIPILMDRYPTPLHGATSGVKDFHDRSRVVMAKHPEGPE